MELAFSFESGIKAAAGTASGCGRQANRAVFRSNQFDIAPLINKGACGTSGKDVGEGRIRSRMAFEVEIKARQTGVVVGPLAEAKMVSIGGPGDGLAWRSFRNSVCGSDCKSKASEAQ